MSETTKTAAPEKADAAAKPAFWAVLPAAVRYNDELPPNAKLLYAEISALTDQRGYCYASNEYFMRLYNLSERTIRRLISELARLGYVNITDGDGGRERRKIYAGINPLLGNPDKNDRVPGQNLPGNPDKNVPHNKKDNKKANNPPKAPQGAGADEKRGAQVLLKLCDLLGEGLLGDEQIFGGGGKALLLCHRDEAF